MTSEEIRALLPHREPFLFVDGVCKLDKDSIEAFYNVSPEAFFFAGHFPGNPILPGVLMVEAIAQAGILLVLSRLGGRECRNTLFAGIDKVRFRRIVRPGEQLLLSCHLLSEHRGLYKIAGVARVGKEVACEAVVWGVLR